MKVYFVLRHILVCLLFCIFLWQTYSSLTKFLSGDTTITIKTENVKEIEFPGVLICGHENPNIKHETNGNSNKYPDFIQGYQHQKGYFKMIVSETKWWQYKPYVKKTLIFCYSYNSEEKYPLGYKSELKVFMDLRSVYRISVLVHNINQNIVVPGFTFGRDFVNVPRHSRTDTFKHLSYKITPKLRHVLQKDRLPCHEENYRISQCLESYVEARENCTLPWGIPISSRSTLCKDEERIFAQMTKEFRASSEEEVYRNTGCYFGCTYYEYHLQKVYDDESNLSFYGKTDVNMELKLVMKAGGLPVEKEVLAFDIHDLVGNIGGFLGLFLGASILSMVDIFKGLWDKLCLRIQASKDLYDLTHKCC